MLLIAKFLPVANVLEFDSLIPISIMSVFWTIGFCVLMGINALKSQKMNNLINKTFYIVFTLFFVFFFIQLFSNIYCLPPVIMNKGPVIVLIATLFLNKNKIRTNK